MASITRDGHTSSPRPRRGGDRSAIDLLWIPLGAGGTGFVRLNGRIYEWLSASVQRRRPLHLYHTALTVAVAGERHVAETTWPSPDGDPATRGVAAQGPVWSRRMAGTRLFRYEVRRWRDGVIPDAADAVGGPRRISADPDTARRLLDLVGSVPPLTWGRDEIGAGDMWNSNSVVSWLLTRAGFDMEGIRPPEGGRAPGWEAGVVAARRP
jgi:hypothetical protein